jgi:hypothetical protein
MVFILGAFWEYRRGREQIAFSFHCIGMPLPVNFYKRVKCRVVSGGVPAPVIGSKVFPG